MSKSVFILILFIAAGCTTFRSIRCGTPDTKTYLNFALDTIANDSTTRHTLITSDKHDRIFEDARFSGRCLSNESIGDYFAKARGDGSFLIVRNDTILLERYYGNFSRLSPSNIFSVSKAVTALLCGIAVDEGYYRKKYGNLSAWKQ